MDRTYHSLACSPSCGSMGLGGLILKVYLDRGSCRGEYWKVGCRLEEVHLKSKQNGMCQAYKTWLYKPNEAFVGLLVTHLNQFSCIMLLGL